MLLWWWESILVPGSDVFANLRIKILNCCPRVLCFPSSKHAVVGSCLVSAWVKGRVEPVFYVEDGHVSFAAVTEHEMIPPPPQYSLGVIAIPVGLWGPIGFCPPPAFLILKWE